MAEARKVAAARERSRYPEGFVSAAQGELALAEGRISEAMPLLERSVVLLRHWGHPLFFLCSESLADAALDKGDVQMALRVLESAAEERGRTYPTFGPSAVFWVRVQVRRSELYRHVGRYDEAGKLEADLRDSLGLGDADHPLLAPSRIGPRTGDDAGKRLTASDARADPSSR